MLAQVTRESIAYSREDEEIELIGEELVRYNSILSIPRTGGLIVNIERIYTNTGGTDICVIVGGVRNYTHILAESLSYFRDINYSRKEITLKNVKKYYSNILPIGTRVAVVDGSEIKGYNFPVPATGVINNIKKSKYRITLDNPVIGEHNWGFSFDACIKESDLDPNDRKVTFRLGDILDVINTDKPAEYKLLDIKDLITN